MPSQARIIRERNSAEWDDRVRDMITGGAYEIEHDYFGITTNQRADKIRRNIRTAASHQGVGCKAFWKPCPTPGQCRNGGSDCQFHVYYTIYDMDKARIYKVKQAAEISK